MSPLMTVHSIIHVPDPRLKQVSTSIDQVDVEIRTLMDDMLATMYAAKGIGLAAIQIGVPKRVVVMDLAGEDEEPRPQYFVNPEITWKSGEKKTYDEGCLSIPDIYEPIERPAQVKARFLDYNGEKQEIEADGLLAVCLQHEIDHTNGILFIDYLSKLKRSMIVRKVQKADRQRGSA